MPSSTRPTLRRRAAAAVGVAAVAAGAVAGTSAVAADAMKVRGKIESRAVQGPECDSPEGLCAEGRLSGKLAGTFRFVASGVIATVDTPSTGVVHVIGDTKIETKGGTLLCTDALTVRTSDGHRFAGLCSVDGGTGALAGATGTLTMEGTFPVDASGVPASGTYDGTLTLP